MNKQERQPHAGDVIEVDGAQVGSPRRSGEILEVLGKPSARHFRVRWEDGRESILYPSSDTRVHVGLDR